MKDDGGPAFPTTDAGGKATAQGMCLRDYFATRLIENIIRSEGVWSADADDRRLEQAKTAYRYADAMLKARSL